MVCQELDIQNKLLPNLNQFLLKKMFKKAISHVMIKDISGMSQRINMVMELVKMIVNVIKIDIVEYVILKSVVIMDHVKRELILNDQVTSLYLIKIT
jgi:hypothetical protein